MTMTWQPIETAPKSNSFKDTIRILVFSFEKQKIEIQSSINWEWYKDNGYTHWMLLPEKPTI